MKRRTIPCTCCSISFCLSPAPFLCSHYWGNSSAGLPLSPLRTFYLPPMFLFYLHSLFHFHQLLSSLFSWIAFPMKCLFFLHKCPWNFFHCFHCQLSKRNSETLTPTCHLSPPTRHGFPCNWAFALTALKEFLRSSLKGCLLGLPVLSLFLTCLTSFCFLNCPFWLTLFGKQEPRRARVTPF